jgi:D-beta-D-heptose 7-phosphate kinase/D-beta-D-heptose 1-phosphate adenosyltransferase
VRELLLRMRRARVLVVGDVMLDRYITGSVERISPEAPVPVVRVEAESTALGGAGNVAASVVALGAACGLVGCVGDDEGGRLVSRELGQRGVGTEGLIASDQRATTLKTRVLARRQQVVRFDREVDDDVTDELAAELAEAIREQAPGADAIILEDYNKGVLVPRVIDAALAEGKNRGIPTVVDPKKMRFFAFAGATVFKPNAKELEDALGERLLPDDSSWMSQTRRRLGCGNLLLTLGERGVALHTDQGDYVRIPTVARAVYDVSGAGDTVTAVMAVAMAAGASVVEAAILANHAAAIEVGKAGVATVSPDEILSQYHESEEVSE